MNKEKLFENLLKSASLIAIASLFFIIFFLVKESYFIFSEQKLLNTLTDQNWYPTENQFLLLPMIIGSLIIMCGTMLIAFPLGFLTAIFCKFYAPAWLNPSINRILEILSGIPAVIYGFWGVMFIVPLLATWQAPGTSLLAGILVLSLIVTPGIYIIVYHSLADINKSLVYNAIALGLSRFSIIRYVVLPQIKQNLLTAISLQSGRAIGETLAVLMVCGNVVQIPGSLFDPVRTLTSNIALEMSYALDVHRSALFLSGLVLLFIVLALTYLANLQGRKTETI